MANADGPQFVNYLAARQDDAVSRSDPPPGYPVSGGIADAPTGGAIPFRPLLLTDILNGSANYLRANPRPALILAMSVIVLSAIMGFAANLIISSVAPTRELQMVVGVAPTVLTTALTIPLVTGLVSPIVLRSMLGYPIGLAELWRRARTRLPALLGFILLQTAAGLALLVAVFGISTTLLSRPVMSVLSVPLALLTIAGIALLAIWLNLVPPIIVLEGKNIPHAIRRSTSLVRVRFGRVLGILTLAGIVTGFVGIALTAPFQVAAGILEALSPEKWRAVVGASVSAIGATVRQSVTTPFLAGVSTLIYLDARIRSEGLDMMLANHLTVGDDDLWLLR